MSDEKPKGREALGEIGARLGDLFGAVRSAFEEIEEKARSAGGDKGDAPQNGGATTTFETPHGPATVSAGWSVRVGGLDVTGGDAGGDDFSSEPIKRGAAKEATEETPPKPRDCQVELFDEPDAWVLTAELPGVAATELVVEASTGTLRFETTGSRRYAHTVAIAPATFDAIDWSAREVRLTNGILEIRAPKKR